MAVTPVNASQALKEAMPKPSSPTQSRHRVAYSQKGEQPWMHGAAGVTGGCLAMITFYPLDFLRTRMHTLHQGSVAAPLRSAAQIMRQEGLKGMYRGMVVSVVSHSVGWGMYLLTFRSAQKQLNELADGDYFPVELGDGGRDFLSACVAATVTGTIITPIHVLKTRRQLYDGGKIDIGQNPHKTYKDANSIRNIVRREGWRAMFRGWGPQIILTGNTTIQVTLYEWFRRNCFTNHEDPSPLQVAVASAVSKAVACALFNPLEVVRTRLQDMRNRGRPDYSSMVSGLSTIWRTEGIRGLYRGLPVNVARVIPSTVMAFVLYEKCLWAIRGTYNAIISGSLTQKVKSVSVKARDGKLTGTAETVRV